MESWTVFSGIVGTVLVLSLFSLWTGNVGGDGYGDRNRAFARGKALLAQADGDRNALSSLSQAMQAKAFFEMADQASWSEAAEARQQKVFAYMRTKYPKLKQRME